MRTRPIRFVGERGPLGFPVLRLGISPILWLCVWLGVSHSLAAQLPDSAALTQPLRKSTEPTAAQYNLRVFADSSVQIQLRLTYAPAEGVAPADAVQWLTDPVRNPWLAHLWGKPQLQWNLSTSATEWVVVGEGRVPFSTFTQWPLAYPNDTSRFGLVRTDAALHAEFALQLPAQRTRAMIGLSADAPGMPTPGLRYEIQMPGAPNAHNADSLDANLIAYWTVPEGQSREIRYSTRVYHFWLALGGLSLLILLLMLGVALFARKLYRRRQMAERAQVEFQRNPPKPHWR